MQCSVLLYFIIVQFRLVKGIYHLNYFILISECFVFQAQNDTELSFDKNERLEIIDKPPSDPDWYKARNTSGQIGLVPKNYLIELSQYLTQDVNKGGSSNGIHFLK